MGEDPKGNLHSNFSKEINLRTIIFQEPEGGMSDLFYKLDHSTFIPFDWF